MLISHLTLKNFRNYTNREISFEDGLNIIIGPNGSGKTNILEAIFLLGNGHSFKTKNESDVIFNPTLTTNKDYESYFDGITPTNKTPVSYLKGKVVDKDSMLIELSFKGSLQNSVGTVKTAKIDSLVKPVTALSRYFQCSLFLPQDLELLTTAPSQRRLYLDRLLTNNSPQYKRNLLLYQKAIRSRNKVLERLQYDSSRLDEIEFWNEKLLESGLHIQSERKKYIDILNPYFKKHFSEMDIKNFEAEFYYIENELNASNLQKSLNKDVITKSTNVGPHRDDFEITICGTNIAYFGSRGEQRSAILALKMAEYSIYSERGLSPVLLLDDVFSELDLDHQKRVLSMTENKQTILTTTQDLTFIHGNNIELIPFVR